MRVPSSLVCVCVFNSCSMEMLARRSHVNAVTPPPPPNQYALPLMPWSCAPEQATDKPDLLPRKLPDASPSGTPSRAAPLGTYSSVRTPTLCCLSVSFVFAVCCVCWSVTVSPRLGFVRVWLLLSLARSCVVSLCMFILCGVVFYVCARV